MTKKRKSYKRPTLVVDSEVHRSDRLKHGNNGFKPTDCSSKRCATCNPPILSTKVIRNLGVQFCSMDPEELSNEKLSQGGTRQESVAKKKGRAKSNKSSRKDKDGDRPSDGRAQGSP